MTNTKHQPDISPEVVAEAQRIARATQAPGQTKEQTRLIAQGIQKGIAEYKRSLKAKQREADKLKKKQRRQTQEPQADQPVAEPETVAESVERRQHPLPWILLALTWIGILAAYLMTHL